MSLPGRIKGIPADRITKAEELAVLTLNKVYAECLPEDLECLKVVQDYYASHLLYLWGFGLALTSSSVGDVSKGNSGVPTYGNKEGMSPYFVEFEKLLTCPDDTGDFLTSR